jgi:hypothetical protein
MKIRTDKWDFDLALALMVLALYITVMAFILS